MYPIFDKLEHPKALEAGEEHHLVKMLTTELTDMSAISDITQAKVTVLKEIVKHHVGEEELDLFKKIEESDINLSTLGQKIVARKDELKASRNKQAAAGKETAPAKTPTRKSTATVKSARAKTKAQAATKKVAKATTAKKSKTAAASSKPTSVKANKSATRARTSKVAKKAS